MLHTRYIAHPGLTAIAAVLALSSTPLAAQEADPAATATAVPAESPPPAADTPSTTAADPLAPEPAAESATAAAAPATTTRRAAATRTQASRPQATRAMAAAAPPAATTVAAPPAEPAAPMVAPAPVPAEDLAAAPMTPDVAPAVSEPFMIDMDQALPIAGAAGLALVGFAGIGMAMRRRRRRNAEEGLSYSEAHMWHEPTVARAEPLAPQQQSKALRSTAAPSTGWTTASAFGWGSAASQVTSAAPTASSHHNESRIDAALRGPTPDNPFLSLKKRLRRAAFFEQRDRAVRNGTAKPISPMAGLPKAMADKTANLARGGNVTARRELAPA